MTKSGKNYDFTKMRSLDTTGNFNKIKVGNKAISDDAFLSADAWGNSMFSRRRLSKERIYQAIERQDVSFLRNLSQYFFNSSGIYKELCRYFAYYFNYDWYITPMRFDKKVNDAKVIEGWYKASRFLENSLLKQTLGEIALKVFVQGQYCGYKVFQKDKVFLQELPPAYCRSRFKHNNIPALEFNVKFFDDMFQDSEQRIKVLKMFPAEFQKAYMQYKKGTLPQDTQNDERGWVLLDPNFTVKFNINDSDIPLLITTIPHLLDLEEIQELDKKRLQQQILKLIIQRFPFDKNGDPVLSVEETQQFHNIAVHQVGDAVGVEVLTTLADVNVEDMGDKDRQGGKDDLARAARTVYNDAGVSQMLFNTEGNLALDKALSNNESALMNLLYQFETYTQSLLSIYNKNPKRLEYKVQYLRTTSYNYKELAKLYKEQTMLGFSRLLPAIALGQSQSSVIATAIFENELLGVNDIFIPPQMSSTMSGKEAAAIDKKEEKASGKEKQQLEEDKGGRPELSDDKKTDKTIENQQAL